MKSRTEHARKLCRCTTSRSDATSHTHTMPSRPPVKYRSGLSANMMAVMRSECPCPARTAHANRVTRVKTSLRAHCVSVSLTNRARRTANDPPPTHTNTHPPTQTHTNTHKHTNTHTVQHVAPVPAAVLQQSPGDKSESGRGAPTMDRCRAVKTHREAFMNTQCLLRQRWYEVQAHARTQKYQKGRSITEYTTSAKQEALIPYSHARAMCVGQTCETKNEYCCCCPTARLPRARAPRPCGGSWASRARG